MNYRSRVIEADKLSQKVLEDLIADKIAAIRIKNFADNAAMQRIRAYIEDHFINFSNYQYAEIKEDSINYRNTGVRRFGIPYNTTYLAKDDEVKKTENTHVKMFPYF